jgi:hypothetical protein
MSGFKIWNEACQQWVDISLGGAGGGGCIDVTYNELVTLIGTSGLTCGSYYRITDYATVHWMVDGDGNYILAEGEKIIHTGANEPLVVLATSANTISTEAWSALYPQDVIKYDWNPANWTGIKNFWDSDLLTTPAGFTGIITRREDTLLANLVNFDFREITYRLWSIAQVAWNSGTIYVGGEYVQNGTVIYWAKVGSTNVQPGVTAGWETYWTLLINLSGFDSAYLTFLSSLPAAGQSIPVLDTTDYVDRIMFADATSNNNQFDEYNYLPYTVFGTECYSNTFGTGCESNTFGTSCYNNTFGTSCYNNTFGTYCYRNTFGTYCYSNTFGTSCNYNTFGTGCYSNTFGTECNYNTFGTSCYNNTFGTNCRYNTFGTDCYSNTFGTGCESNTFGTECRYNTFGADCYSNTFGTNCRYNTFGTGCGSNTFGTYCRYNTFGTYCESNTFGTYCYSNTFGTYCNYNTFGTSCESNTFGDYCGYYYNEDTEDEYFGGNILDDNCNNNIFGNYCLKNKLGTDCDTNTFPSCTWMNELKAGIKNVNYTLSTPIADTNITHQISNNNAVYQTYIDDSGVPTIVITTDTIGTWSLCPITTTTTTTPP